MTVVHIATAIDDRYVTPLQVMLASLVARLAPDARAVLHVVHRSLTAASRDKLSTLVETRFVEVGASAQTAFPFGPNLAQEAGYLLLFPELLSELERVLFLDADLLVLDDVTPLWVTDLEGHSHAATIDPAVPRCSGARGVVDWRERRIPPSHSYFNAGVLLIDLAAWRQRSVAERALAYLRERGPSTPLAHQGALNAITWNDWRRLDRRWNVFGSFVRRNHSPTAARPAIVHFSGRMKPWLAPVGGPFEDAYLSTMASLELTRPPAGPARRALSLYDRYGRSWLYPIERAAWKRGWI